VLTKSQGSSDFQSTLLALLCSQHVGFVFSERLINMPPAIMPPMYRMLSDEIKWAINDVSNVTQPGIQPAYSFKE
jgi:protein BCP1